MALPVHFHTFIPINRLDLPINASTVLHVHRCTWSSLYCSACPQMYLFITIPVQLYSSFSAQHAQWPFKSSLDTYTQIHPKISVPVYPHASPLPKTNDLPVSTTTCVPAHSCTRSWPYLFIFILSFRLTVKIYSSTFPLFHMSTDVPVNRYTCSVYVFIFRHNLRNDLSTHILGYLQINPSASKFTCLPSCFSFV